MFDCSYCHRTFATKQRLISHLTRNNKCYDVSVTGVPPILLGLIGVSKEDQKKITGSTLHSSSTQKIEGDDRDETKQKIVEEEVKEEVKGDVKTDLQREDHMNTSQPFDDQIPIIFRSEKENKNIKIIKKIKPIKKICTHKSNIKYIKKENYFDCLTEQLGSREHALNFIRKCIQGKIRGGINLLYKIYFEGKDSSDYPIEVVDSKSKKIYYKTPNDIVLDENATYVKSVLVDNLRNCYLQFCNHIISTNLDDNGILFDDYDLGEIQNHLLELSDDKKKDRIIMGLIEQTKK